MIKKVTVSIEPFLITGLQTHVRVKVLHDDRVTECAKVFTTDHFEPLFDMCLREAATEIREAVKARLT